MKRLGRIGLLALSMIVVASCGGTPGIAPASAEELAQRAADVRAAVESGNRDAAHAALAALRASVEGLDGSDAISDEKVVEIIVAANGVQALLDLMPTTTTTTTPDDDDDDDDGFPGGGKGKGHGKGKD